jgi:tRNA pseudouridine55 synthase
VSSVAVAVDTTLVDGVLTLDKPAGWTSHDVVAKVRSVIRGAKIGHAGTLDPSATGVLPILIGQATRIAEYLVGWDKEYRAVLRLGAVTDTQDATGVVLEQKPVPPLSFEQVRNVARRFEGTIAQVPPMYSAVKVGGVPLYRSARAGKHIAREPRMITIHELELLEVVGGDIHLRVRCSKGTYIRTLCADLGEMLGCGGHLLSLRRTRVGPLAVEQALTIEDVRRRWEAGTLGERLLSLDDALVELPVVVVDDVAAERVRHGAPVAWSALRELRPSWLPDSSGLIRIKDAEGRLLALGLMPADQVDKAVEHPEIRVKKVFGGRERGRIDT